MPVDATGLDAMPGDAKPVEAKPGASIGGATWQTMSTTQPGPPAMTRVKPCRLTIAATRLRPRPTPAVDHRHRFAGTWGRGPAAVQSAQRQPLSSCSPRLLTGT